MIKKQITLHKDDVCPVCREKFLTEQKTLEKPILDAAQVGAVHQACFFPYHIEEKIKILFQIRCWSIGDTIAATPVLREVRRLYPRASITVATFYPELFQYNQNMDAILDMTQPISQDMIDEHQFILDAFNIEKSLHFSMHSVDFSALSALHRSILPTEWGYDVRYGESDLATAIQTCKDAGIDHLKDKVIVLHPHGTEWVTRDWGPNHMPKLLDKLRYKYPDYKFVSIGGKRGHIPGHEMKNYVPLYDVIELYGKFSLLQSAAFLDLPAIKLLVTPDTGTLHLGATCPELPIVGIFTLVKAHFRTPVRNKLYSYKFMGVEADSNCNCTMTNRILTNEMRFDRCPKREFLEHTLRNNLPRNIKAEGIYNLFGFKPKETSEIREELKRFEPGNLPCFPGVEKVFNACVKMIEAYNA